LESNKYKTTVFLHYSFDNRHSSFLSASSRKSDASRPTVKADGYRVSFDNDRNLARAIGVLQHCVKVFGLFDHIIIVNLAAFFGKSFTSCPGIRSSIFSEKQNFIGHIFLLVWAIVIVKKHTGLPTFFSTASYTTIPFLGK
jgi:hypothetical protein